MGFFRVFKSARQPTQAPAEQSLRCKHIYPGGRRCTLTIPPGRLDFCAQHGLHAASPGVTEEQRDAERAQITAEVYGPVKSLDSATAIHHVLSNLFRLTLEDRIPQRKAAQLTTQLRAGLKALEARRDEILTAKLFPHNHGALLALLALLNGDDAESETVAPHSSLHRVRPDGRTCSAAFTANNSTSTSETARSVIAAEACAVSASRAPHGNSPGSEAIKDLEKLDELSDATNRETVAPTSSSAIFREEIPESTPTPEQTSEVIEEHLACPEPERRAAPTMCRTTATANTQNDPPQQTYSTDNVLWIGPKPDQIDWTRLEQDKEAYERYLRQAYPPTLNGYHRIPPDKIPLYRRGSRRRRT